MKQVMTLAWRLAKKGATKFGGSPVDYLSESLKIAWKMVGDNVQRPSKKAELVIASGSRKHKSWVARIDGTHAQYEFNRTFIDAQDINVSERTYTLGKGIYEVCDAGERYFIRIVAGKIERVDENAVKVAVA